MATISASKLRDAGQYMPVIMLTARSAAEERVRGLDSGADDYMPKPFELPELLARVRSALRRSGWQPGRIRPRRQSRGHVAFRHGAHQLRYARGHCRRQARATDPAGAGPASTTSRSTRAGCCRARNCWSASGSCAMRPTRAASTTSSSGCASISSPCPTSPCTSCRIADRDTGSSPDGDSKTRGRDGLRALTQLLHSLTEA